MAKCNQLTPLPFKGSRAHWRRYFFDQRCISWLLRLCAQAAAVADDKSSNETDATLCSSTLSTAQITRLEFFSFGRESVIRVGRKVTFQQAVELLSLAGRAPDVSYVRDLFKVVPVSCYLENWAAGAVLRGARGPRPRCEKSAPCAPQRPQVKL